MLILAAAPAGAVDFGGTIQLFWTDTQQQGQSSGFVDQRYSLVVEQELSPYLSLALRLRLNEQQSSLDGQQTFTRRDRNPRIDLRYLRPKLSARLSFEDRITDGTLSPNNFEARALTGSLDWRPRPRLRLNLGFRDANNQGDVGALGRDFDDRQVRLEAFYARESWGGSYAFSRSELENRKSGARGEQDRHDLRLHAASRFLNDRLTFGLSALAGRVERRDRSVQGDLADPLAAGRGLFAIDPTPDLGELDDAPLLIDGDTLNATIPVIEIGGANTFRNVGVDLGVTRPVSRLEISVDGSSGPQLVWEVYRSRDNLFWEPVGQVLREYDDALLRYVLRFPETEDRYFKAVNVSVNPVAQVRVTEARALLDRDLLAEEQDSQSDLYRVDLSGSYLIGKRVQASVAIGGSNDQTQVGGLNRQDYRTAYARAALSADLGRDLRLSVDYGVSDTEDRQPPVLLRTTEELNAALHWNPLDTVDAVLSAGIRDESDDGTLLQSSSSYRLGVGLQLLPGLRLDTQLNMSQIEDPFSGFDRDSWSITQRANMRPLDSWQVRTGYTYSVNDSPAQERLLERTQLFLESNWSPGSYLSLSAGWRFFDDGGGNSLRQTYGVSFTPGAKLSLSLGWEEFDAQTGRLTGNENLNLAYRLARGAVLFGSLSRSRTELENGTEQDIKSLRLGTTIFF